MKQLLEIVYVCVCVLEVENFVFIKLSDEIKNN